MKWIAEDPPKDSRILAVFNYMGTKRASVVIWDDRYNSWRIELSGNHLIIEPIKWMYIPEN